MNKKKKYSIFLVLLSSLFLLSFLSAGNNAMTSPINYGNYTTSITVSVNTNGNGPTGNMTNISCYYNVSGGTADYSSGAPRLVEIYNTTTQQVNFSQAVTVSSFTQANQTYNITCLVQNATGTAITVNKTLEVNKISIDYTAPVVTISTDKTSADTKKDIVLTWTSTDATTGIYSTAVSVTSAAGMECIIDPISFTDTSSSDTLTGDETKCGGLYTATITATDFNSQSTSASTTFTMMHPTGGTGTIPSYIPVKNVNKVSIFTKIASFFKWIGNLFK